MISNKNVLGLSIDNPRAFFCHTYPNDKLLQLAKEQPWNPDIKVVTYTSPPPVFNALGVTDWGLKNNYVTGEWWRGDTRAGWWEYCMYDWQNRYNDSWRIRPLYVINLSGKCIQRIPGGMYHWLFNSVAFSDLLTFIGKKIG